MARPVCLYCGAALPAEAVAAAVESAAGVTAAASAPPEGAPARTLLVVDCASADAATLGAALELAPYEAGQRHRRQGLALEGVLEPAAAEREAARLRAAGLVVFLVPESLARVEPWLAVAGVREKDGLRLRGAAGSRSVAAADLLLVVRGPIEREYQAPLMSRKIQTARLEGGHRLQLHLCSSPQVLELEPGDFDFGARPAIFGSSLLEMNDWLEALVQGAVVDEAFRYETPALGPGTGPGGPLAATSALSRSTTGRDKGQATVIHDNLRQFRFYSSWRGAVERIRMKTE
jgi:hypothetical protein